MKISWDSIQCGLRQRLLSQNQVNRRVGFTEEKPREETPFQVYQPPVVNADEEYDKENMPVSYERQFSRRSEPQQGAEEKRPAVETYHSVVADIDMDDDGSLTKQDSESSWLPRHTVASRPLP